MPAKLNTNEFIKKSVQVHGNKYDYSKSIYTGSMDKITIICKSHGEFSQTASQHMLGSSCPICARDNVGLLLHRKNKSTAEEFIKKANKVHNSTYTYTDVTYINSKTKVAITCPYHGNFLQTPNDHLDGCGCPKCKYRDTKSFWSHSDWETAGKSSKNFNGYTLYVIKCYNDNEAFIKIGKTFQDTKIRFQKGVKMPYSWDTVYEIKNTAKVISTKEHELHMLFKAYSYTPLLKFGGCFECYSLDVLDNLTKIMEEL